jgi:hypothetical protein
VLVQLLDRISEDEMIDVFLRGELQSPRWREKILALGELDARTLLEQHRAYERREGLFLFFPREVDWFRALVTRDELLDIRYINWDWWLEASDGTREPLVLVEGHARLTACALFPERVPAEAEILLGVSEDMADWCQW